MRSRKVVVPVTSPVTVANGRVVDEWASDLATEVEAFLCSDASETSVLACAALAVLDVNADAASWPLFAPKRRSLFKALVSHAGLGTPAFWAALEVVSDDEVAEAANIARWVLRLPQQGLTGGMGSLVFVNAPRSAPARRSRRTAPPAPTTPVAPLAGVAV